MMCDLYRYIHNMHLESGRNAKSPIQCINSYAIVIHLNGNYTNYVVEFSDTPALGFPTKITVFGCYFVIFRPIDTEMVVYSQ